MTQQALASALGSAHARASESVETARPTPERAPSEVLAKTLHKIAADAERRSPVYLAETVVPEGGE